MNFQKLLSIVMVFSGVFLKPLLPLPAYRGGQGCSKSPVAQVNLNLDHFYLDTKKGSAGHWDEWNGQSHIEGNGETWVISYSQVGTEKRLTMRKVQRAFQEALKRAGITDFYFHDIRHFMRVKLVMNGVSYTIFRYFSGIKTFDHRAIMLTWHRVIGQRPVNVLDRVFDMSQNPHRWGGWWSLRSLMFSSLSPRSHNIALWLWIDSKFSDSTVNQVMSLSFF